MRLIRVQERLCGAQMLLIRVQERLRSAMVRLIGAQVRSSHPPSCSARRFAAPRGDGGGSARSAEGDASPHATVSSIESRLLAAFV
jgi:hypothetical protein